MDAIEIDRVISNVTPSTSIEESLPLVQEVAMQKELPSTSIQESVPVVQEDAVKIVAPSTSVPQIPEQEGNAASVRQLPIHPEVSTIKTKKQQTFYE
ncbi:hypothetical protein D8674_038107 [Pyrus ussuriensis x Pyrus communis]|uniref:Uncharacterized protein n=1 Tax=Pyrus ussuriensis x Pyrus communis TaxID=2448454 RepID=A0A5N5I879_9ROSA|nr:hypothetical protein D8674_038107 [Pyrus ussuriensis x Pyrus communis]